jgi:hypothetical protein
MNVRKKLIIVQAEQVHEYTYIGETIVIPLCVVTRFLRPGLWVKTLEGWYRVKLGDWIITGVKGEHYPIRADIFEETYESVPVVPQDSL